MDKLASIRFTLPPKPFFVSDLVAGALLTAQFYFSLTDTTLLVLR
jgi:hypothetical protein